MILLFILTILVSLFIINHSRTEFIGCFDNKFLMPIRGVLALLICWHHISLECISYGTIYQEFRLCVWGGVIVGQFFFISGYGLFYSWSHKDGCLKSFLSRSFKIICTICCCVIIICIKNIFRLKIDVIRKLSVFNMCTSNSTSSNIGLWI